jgi:hypothetical protein
MRSNSNSEIHVGHDVRFPAGTGGRNGDYKTGELRVWNVARTQAQISANMSSCLTGTETGLTLYNKFENGTGGSATSVVGPNGTLVNMNTTTNWVTGSGSECCSPASALNFDGVNDDVRATGFSNFTEYTIEGWFNLNSLVDQNLIVGTGNGNPNTWYTNQLQLNGGKFTHYLYDGAVQIVNSPITPVTGVWYHVAIVAKNGTPVSIYVNGIPSVSTSNIGSMSGANEYRMAGTASGILASFNGKMDEVRIWNVARSQCEINTYMNCEIPTIATSLLANYHFNQGVDGGANTSATTLTDASGNTNTGTLTNFALSGTTSNWIAPGAVVTGYTTTLASPTITVNSGSIIGGSSFTMTPNGADTYVYMPSGPVVSPVISTAYTITGTNSVTTCSNTAVSTVSVQGAALNFDGVNDRVNLGNGITTSLSGGTKVSVEAWVKPTSLSGLGCIIGNYNTGSTGLQILLRRSGNSYYEFWVGNGGTWYPTNSVATPTLNVWQHVAATWDGTVAKIYVNGVLSGTTTPAMSTLGNASNNPVWLGGNTINENFTGSMDEVRIWSRTLCLGEIQNNINGELSSGQTNLLAYYKMNQGYSALANPGLTTLTDASGNSLNGTLTNFTLTGTISNWVAPGAITTGSLSPAFVSPVIAVAGATTICSGTPTTFTASGNVSTYAWVSGPTTATNIVVPTTTTTYSVVGTNSLGCVSNMATQTLTVNTLPTITINSGAICSGQSFTMVPSGADTYSYTGGTDVVSPTADATYSVSGTDANGCVSNIDAVSSVTVNALPTISVNSGTICTGQSFTMVPSGATTYTYSNGTDVVSPTADATYSVSGTDANGCVSSTAAVSNVTVNALPTISVNSGAICTGQSFTMVPTGASTYTYSSGTDVVMPTADATYSVSGTDANGCVSSTDAISSVTVNALPMVMTSTSNTLLCSGQTATLSAMGTTSYTWSTTETTTDIAVTPTSTAVYTVTGTDVNGCVNTTTVQQDVSLCTDIQSSVSNQQSSISVYPNPTGGIVNVELEILNGNNVSIQVSNMLGEILINESVNTQHSTFNIQHFTTGVYFVKVIENNKQQVIKLIKQ